MSVSRVCVIGGGGFIGRHVCALLAARGVPVLVPTRHRERAKTDLIVLPGVELLSADVHDDVQLRRLVAGCGAVINLSGILHQQGRNTFQRVHVELTRRVLAACRAGSVTRYLHMSALRADPNGPSQYLRTKGEAEALVRASTADGIEWTIFRPSVVFGRGDSFLGLFASLLGLAPFVPLGSPHARFQPVWVEDVAHAFVTALDERATVGQSYELCGPRVYTLRELVELAGRLTGRSRPVIGLPAGLSYLQAAVFECLPVKLITRDNYRSMQVDSVCGCAYPPVFGRAPAELEPVAARYLGGEQPRARYDLFRSRVRR